MDNYGCILHGNLGTTWHLLDGWKSNEPEEGFDTVTATLIASSSAYMPSRQDNIGTSFGFSALYITQQDLENEGDVVVANIVAKGIKDASAMKVRCGSTSTQTTGNEVTITDYGPPPVYTITQKIYRRFDPNVTISRVSTSTSSLTPGDVADPPIIPVTPQVLGTGSIENSPYGWVVEAVEQDGVTKNILGTASVPVWFITERWQYVQQFADGI